MINQTTLEFMENKKDALRGSYDKGVLKNCQEVLGENFLVWCIPARTHL